jgi:hypothetical protein
MEASNADYCTGVGFEAMKSLDGGASNTAVGVNALFAVTTGTQNTAVGRYAGDAISTGNYNTAMGIQALTNCTTSDFNSAFGRSAGQEVTTGEKNTLIGNDAGSSITTGSNNTCLGNHAGQSSSPSGTITTGSHNVVLGNNSVANLYCADTSISSSDARDKTDVEDFKHGLSWITELRPVTYRWDRRTWYSDDKSVTPDGSKKRDRIHIGFLAQEAIEVEKKHGYAAKKDDMLIVNQDEDEKDPSYGMKYERLVPVLVNAIKELSAENNALKARLDAAGL